MRVLGVLENPWCLFSLLLLICLLLIAGALVSWSRQVAIRTQPLQHAIIATAPFEALNALYTRLAELQHHVPAGSDDARWLASYVHDLRSVIDEAYFACEHLRGTQRQRFLEHLGSEVARLDQHINTHIDAKISRSSDRQALRAQLERVRAMVNRQ
jgi:hypothetical protein